MLSYITCRVRSHTHANGGTLTRSYHCRTWLALRCYHRRFGVSDARPKTLSRRHVPDPHRLVADSTAPAAAPGHDLPTVGAECHRTNPAGVPLHRLLAIARHRTLDSYGNGKKTSTQVYRNLDCPSTTCSCIIYMQILIHVASSLFWLRFFIRIFLDNF